MPDILCISCGNKIKIDVLAVPYIDDVTRRSCRNTMSVEVRTPGQQTMVKAKYPEPESDVGYSTWYLLNEVERLAAKRSSLARQSDIHSVRIYGPSGLGECL